MKPGDVIRMKSIRSYQDGPVVRGYSTWKPPEGQIFVCLLLGTEPLDGSDPLDANKRLEEFGWKPPSEANDN
jgi:hypothetical protein